LRPRGGARGADHGDDQRARAAGGGEKYAESEKRADLVDGDLVSRLRARQACAVVGYPQAQAPPRQRFFEREQFEAVRRRLPDDLQVAVSLAYTFGWCMQSEVLTLERRQLDLDAGTLRLDPGSTKNATPSWRTSRPSGGHSSSARSSACAPSRHVAPDHPMAVP
jgi:integrase